MDRSEMMAMDPNILVSVINMKLRDYYSSLDILCEDLQIDRRELENKLKDAGYLYMVDVNQFK